MGKARRVGRVTTGTTTLHYVRQPPANDEPCRPSVDVPVTCSSCESDALVNGLTFPPECNLGICFRFWTQMDLGCMVCHEREPVRTFDCTEKVPVAKAIEILARCELQCAYNVGGFVITLNSASHYQSAEILRRVSSHITKLYKKVRVVKRPKDVIEAMTQDLRGLDVDVTINGKDMVLFKCSDGALKITCNQVILGHKMTS